MEGLLLELAMVLQWVLEVAMVLRLAQEVAMVLLLPKHEVAMVVRADSIRL